MNLYIYAAIHRPVDDEGKIKVKECKLVIEPTNVLAASPEAVGMIAARALPNDVVDDIDNVEILVRPF